MAGQFTGLIYDDEVAKQRIEQSTNPLSYRLDPVSVVHCGACYEPEGLPGSGNNYNTADVIDTDSFLRNNHGSKFKSFTGNRPRNYDRTNPEAYDKYQSFPHEYTNKRKHSRQPRHYGMYDCPTNTLESVSTRHIDPAFNIKGMGPKDMRLDYPLRDPQCNIFENFQVNTRLQSKDDHKAKWPKMIDQTSFFPVERKNRFKNCTVTVNCDHQYSEL